MAAGQAPAPQRGPRPALISHFTLSRLALFWLVGVLALVLILTSALVLWDESRFLERELENRARTLASLLVNAAAEDGNPSRIPLAGLPELRWAKISEPGGDTIWQFGRPPGHAGGEPLLDLEENYQVPGGAFHAELAVSTVGVRLHVVHSGLRLVLGLALALAIALVVGAVLFERVTAPLEALGRQMATFHPESPLPEQLPEGGSREINELGKSFSAMAQRLVEQRRELLESERLREAQKMEAVATLAGGVAHDFNNLLTAVLLHVRLLEQGEGDDGTVAAIRRLAEEGVEVVNELLLFARRESAPEEEIDLAELIRSQEALLRNLLPEGVALEITPGTQPVPVRGTRIGLRRVLLNLVLNARQAVPSPKGRIVVATTAEDGEAALRVIDNGSGIPNDAREHLFEPFWSRRREGRGAGLGLAVVYSLVHQHGGRVLVDSAPGQGTCMTVRLPLATEEAGTEGAVEESPEAGLRVLLVDDDGRRAAARMEALADHGFELRHASGVAEAGKLSESWGPDVMVVAARVMDGEGETPLPEGPAVVIVGDAEPPRAGHAAAVVSELTTSRELAGVIRRLARERHGS